MTNKLFVYGTLKRGFGNNVLLKNSKFIGKAVTEDYFDVYSCGFPCAYPNPNGKKISGEIYELSREDFIVIDSLESNGFLYEREVQKFYCYKLDKTLDAWIYIIISPYGSLYESNSDVIDWGYY